MALVPLRLVHDHACVVGLLGCEPVCMASEPRGVGRAALRRQSRFAVGRAALRMIGCVAVMWTADWAGWLVGAFCGVAVVSLTLLRLVPRTAMWVGVAPHAMGVCILG